MNIDRWRGLNPGSLVLEATALPTVQTEMNILCGDLDIIAVLQS